MDHRRSRRRVVVIVALLARGPGLELAPPRSICEEQFGPEYDRAVEAGSRRQAAERELGGSGERARELDLKPLSEAARTRFKDEWQKRPAALRRRSGGGRLAGRATRPAASWTSAATRPDNGHDRPSGLVSVDHPDVVERYRDGARRSRRALAGGRTENLRRHGRLPRRVRVAARDERARGCPPRVRGRGVALRLRPSVRVRTPHGIAATSRRGSAERDAPRPRTASSPSWSTVTSRRGDARESSRSTGSPSSASSSRSRRSAT